MTDPKNNDFSERLQAYYEMETECAEIYHSLVTLFPEAGDLFKTLAEWEERHADIISISIGFSDIGGISDTIVPGELSMINKTLEMTHNIMISIETEKVTLEDILGMVLKMEESMGESYLYEVMTKRTNSEAISYLQQFYKDEKTHAEMIKEFMVNEGFNREFTA